MSPAILLLSAALGSSAGPKLEAFLGASASAATPLLIRQAGAEDLSFTASWSTASFNTPPYWAVRLGWGLGAAEASVEVVHHKLFLERPPPGVDRFSISHGFNLVLLGAAVPLDGRVLARAGLGVVVAHPESSIRGEEHGAGEPLAGFSVSGVAASAGLERRFPLARVFFASLSLSASVAWARVPVARGTADVSDVALHARVGLGVGRP